jgi:hypothetical protein
MNSFAGTSVRLTTSHQQSDGDAQERRQAPRISEFLGAWT